MKFPTLILVSYLATLLGCTAANRPGKLKSSSQSAELEENSSGSGTEDEIGTDTDTHEHPETDDSSLKTGNGNDTDNSLDKDPEMDNSTDSDSESGNETGDNKPMPVPVSNKIVYRPLGLTQGGYASIKEAVWPNKCVKGAIVPTTGALFPFNETQTLVLRGPLDMADFAVYEKAGGQWKKLGDISNLRWNENNFGTIKDLGPYPMKAKVLENGRELFTHLPEKGEKIVIVKIKMPMANTPVYSSGAQDNVPAVWMLNSRIFKAPSAQYFCNCRGVGSPGGCGELDIAEIVPEKKNEVSTTLYTYEGGRGGVLSKPRPTTNYQIYAAVLRSDGTAGEVSVLEMDSFDFSVKEFDDSFVSKDWLPSAKSLNKGNEALLRP